MATKIEWTDEVWNCVRGCSRVSPGCDHCYAMRMARRQDYFAGAYEGLTRKTERGIDWSGEVRFVEDKLGAPLRWRKPRHVFVNSMGDLFHEKLHDADIADVFGVMAVAAKRFWGPKNTKLGPHTFQVLTKRAGRMARLVGSSSFRELVSRAAYRWAHDRTDAGWLAQCISWRRDPGNRCTLDKMWPLPNVWLGVTAEDQTAADERIPLLLQVPAAVRFVSVEPMLEAVCLNKGAHLGVPLANGTRWKGSLPILDWVIAGCESGPGARRAGPLLFRSLRDQCQDAGVPFFLKQMMVDGRLVKMPELDGRVWDQVPR